MRGAMQTAAFLILLTVALLADGLMDSLGPVGFMLVVGSAILIAGLLVCWSDRPRKRSAAPEAAPPGAARSPAKKAEQPHSHYGG